MRLTAPTQVAYPVWLVDVNGFDTATWYIDVAFFRSSKNYCGVAVFFCIHATVVSV